ncbi:PREDICTED: uncharacterized protein LOC109478118 [Branchiostoma belcheri]|uniref:Uncharacterized protein LOC109478118 n=1 Tax=Branchiostoma belcheri TaxID=7741 RepID=A0A6P4ZW49_BRABE|nr:PREDICTED: uncharacterized protein LOC109478118 [Branchiostoma belcheri]
MVQRKALVLLLLVSNRLLFVLEAAQCPENCYSKVVTSCRCPDPNGESSPCSWVGNGGTYSFPVCLDAIPTDLPTETVTVLIEHLTSPKLIEQSFQNLPILIRLHYLNIRQSNVSTIQPGAFRVQGLRHLNHLYLIDNLISRLEPGTFLGLGKLVALLLDKNMISSISKHAFRGLPQLWVLRLSQNRLTSVPVNALLDLKFNPLLLANVQRNHITTIDKDVMRLLLGQTRGLNLDIRHNKLRCDKDLTWFICNLPDLPQITKSNFLKCASPPDLRGTNLTTLENELCQTDEDRTQQETESKPFTEQSMTTASRNDTIPTEGHTEMSLNSSVSEHTTQINYVINFGGNPVINDGVNMMVTAIITAVTVPPLLVLAIGVILFIIKVYLGTDLPHHAVPTGSNGEGTRRTETDDIEPYAVAYDDSVLPGVGHDRNSTTSGRPTPARNKTPEDNYTIQPYAVTYDEQPGSQLQSHTEASNDDLEQDDNYEIQPYAVGYPDSPQAERGRADADLPTLENSGTDEQATNGKGSFLAEDDIRPNFEAGEAQTEGDPTGDGDGPYGMDGGDESQEMQQYKSGSQATKHSACSAYNPHD